MIWEITENHLKLYFEHYIFFFKLIRYFSFYAIKIDLGPHYKVGNSPLRHDNNIYFGKFYFTK